MSVDKNIGIKQLGPALFNIPCGVQQKMIINLLDTKYGYTDDELEYLWKQTQDSFLNGDKRDSVVYKLNKIYKKKGDSAEEFYVAKLKREYEKSKMKVVTKKNKLGIEAEPPWTRGITWQKEDYGKFQTIINSFLYATQDNDYFKWALDYKKFSAWGQELSEMFVTVPTSRETLKEDIAKNNKKFLIESRSGLIEASLNITRQCLASCGQKPQKGNGIKCYICGELINNISGEAKEPDGSQCEHVVPVTSLAALCGLSGDDYEKTIDNYFSKYSGEKNKDGTINIDGEVITREKYNLWRKRLIGDRDNNNNPRPAATASNYLTREHGGGLQNEGVLYRWAHPACNMIKKDYAFVGLNWTPARDNEEWERMKEVGFPILNSREVAAASGANSTDDKKVIYDYCDEEGIKYVLNCLSNIKQGGGGSLSSSWRKKFFPGKKAARELTRVWVEGRYKAMRDNTMKWAANSILSRDPDSGKYNDEYGIPENKWPEFRTALCELSMSILDFRVEEKIELHYSKFIKKTVSKNELKAIVEEWRKAEWFDLVGQDSEEEVAGMAKVAFGDKTNLYPKQKIDPLKTPRVKGEDAQEMIPNPKRQKTVSFNKDPKKLDPKDLHFSLGKETTRKKTKTKTRKKNSQPIDDTSKNINQIGEMKKFSDYNSHWNDTRMELTGIRTRGVELLKELNDNKLILQIYLDVLNPIKGFNSDERIYRAKIESEKYRNRFQYNFETFNIEILPKTLKIDIINETKCHDFLNERRGSPRLRSDDTETGTRNVRHKAKKKKSKKKNTKRKKKNTKRKKKNTKRKKNN